MLEATTSTDPPHELLLFADDGWLSSLELVTYDNDPPAEFLDTSAFGAPGAWGHPTTPPDPEDAGS